MSLLNIGKLSALAALAFVLLIIGLWVDGHIVAVAATMPSEELSAMVRTVFRVVTYTTMMVPTFGIIMGVMGVMHDHRFEKRCEARTAERFPFWCKFDRIEGNTPDIARFETREELDSFMANTVHRVTEYGPRVAGLTIDDIADAVFIINRHAIKCISEVFVCKDGYTWLALRDELIFSVIYEDADICHCKVVPGFEWLVFDYLDEGVIPVSMVEVANA